MNLIRVDMGYVTGVSYYTEV